MPEALVLCGGEDRPVNWHSPLELDVAEHAPSGRRIDFNTARVSASLRDDLPDVLADALEVAAYVYCADRLITRSRSKQSAGIGAEWQRRFRFRIPVRRPDVWLKREIVSALVEALTFLSGDRFSFEFTQARAPVSLEPYLGFEDRDAQIIRPDKVILFSGGLDSLAGIARDVLGAGKSALLVTHQSATQIQKHQDDLGDAIVARAGAHQAFYVPVRVGRGLAAPREHSQRLRSFLFATLGLAYSKMFGLATVHFYENGVTSFNLPVAEHVLGTRASRTTHPKVFAYYQRFFSLLLADKIQFENPFLWNTKTDVVRLISEHGCADLIGSTTSCANIRRYSMTGQQCGTCSQCVERRVAMLGAGLTRHERPYASDMFLGPIEDGRDLTMIEGHLLRANKLASMSQHTFLANHGQIFRAFGSMGCSPNTAAQNAFELHQRYGREFVSVVDRQFAAYATVEKARLIHEQSLLGMLLQRRSSSRPFIDAIELEKTASRQVAAQHNKPRVLTIVLAVDRDKKRILFADGLELKGRAYSLLERLISIKMTAAHEARADQQPPFTMAKVLASQLGMTEPNLRQGIERIRKKIEQQYEASHGYTIDQNDVIENATWSGYRLNPNVLIAPMSELVRRSNMSHKIRESVTQAA